MVPTQAPAGYQLQTIYIGDEPTTTSPKSIVSSTKYLETESTNMVQRGLQCYLCVERPPPADLKNHLMFHHMIENDLAVMAILQMHGKKHCETQTTVTWTQDFD